MKKLKLTLFLLLTGLYAFSQDAYLSGLAINGFLKSSTNYTLSLNLMNTLTTPIYTGSVNWKVDNGSVHPNSFNVGGSGVTNANYLPLTLTPSMNLTVGSHTLKVWVSVAGDSDHSNDTITKNLIAMSNYAGYRVLMEEYTATWCTNCPAANTVVNSLSTSPYVNVASFHCTDTYSTTEGTAYMEAYYPSSIYTPGGMVNMGELGEYDMNYNHPAWNSEVMGRASGVSPVDLTVTATMDTTARTLSFSATANFKYVFTSDFYFNVYVLENFISGTQSGATNPYAHQHVVRKMVGGQNGVTGIIPALPTASTDYIYSDVVTIPSGWVMRHLDVVAVVFQKESGNTRALNSARKIMCAGVEDVEANNSIIRVFPNPTTDYISLVTEINGNDLYQYDIFDMSGKKVQSGKMLGLQGEVIDFRGFEEGLYLLKLTDAKGITHTCKVMKSKN